MRIREVLANNWPSLARDCGQWGFFQEAKENFATLEESEEEVPDCHPMRPHPPVLTAVVEQQLGPWPEGRLSRASLPCGGGADPIWSPQLLLYSSTQELQTLAALKLQVGMLDQQIHLEKVLPE